MTQLAPIIVATDRLGPRADLRPAAARRTTGARGALLALLLTLGALAAVAGWGSRRAATGRHKPADEVRQAALVANRRAELQAVVRPHLRWADQASREALTEHLESLDALFAQARRNTPRFAERALSWGSKWRFVVDRIPGTRGDRHQRFLRESFGQYLFKPEQLEAAVRQAIQGYLDHLQSIESQMLVRIRADLDDFPASAAPLPTDPAQLQVAFDRAVARAAAATGSSLRADLAGELVSTIAGEVLAQVAVRLGVSAGILGAGAATSWASFGVGLVVAAIVDQLVTWIWHRIADPVANLAAELNGKLAELRRLIVAGSPSTMGLRDRLLQCARQRAALRERAVFDLLRQAEGGHP